MKPFSVLKHFHADTVCTEAMYISVYSVQRWYYLSNVFLKSIDAICSYDKPEFE